MMKKDIELLKYKLEGLQEINMRMLELCEPNSEEQHHLNGSLVAIEKVLEIVNDLDEEPYSIQKLIHDYEYKTGTFDWATALRGVLRDGSEETEVKKDREYIHTDKLETLVVPTDLGEWLQSREIGESWGYFSTIDALYHYWDSIISSPTGSFIIKNKKELIEVILGTREYEVEEPLHHALIKGHDVSNSDDIYWNYDKYDNDVFVSRLYPSHDNFLTEMSKSEWNGLGINDSNADFVEVAE